MATDRPTGGRSCTGCAEGTAHCHATLVLHADGSLACTEVEACAALPELHQWWIACTEMASQCGCTGDEHPGAGGAGDGVLAQAA